jgi:hypothetical protein
MASECFDSFSGILVSTTLTIQVGKYETLNSD